MSWGSEDGEGREEGCARADRAGPGWGTLSLTWKLTVPLGLLTVLWALSATFLLPLMGAGRSAALGLLGALAVLAVAGAGLLVARGMITRLHGISEVAGRFAAGNLSARAEVAGGDEIGALGAAFNAMADRLQHVHELLEQRVGERTRDLTRANSELARIVRAKSEFLANISHELRTPLNAILGYSEVLADQTFFGPPSADEVSRHAGVIHQSGRHLLALVNDLLDLARVEAGRLDLHLEDVDIRSTVRDVLMLMEPLSRSKGQTLRIRIGNVPARVRADDKRLRQILLNLLSNAVKFTPDGGLITVEATVQGSKSRGCLELSVADTGIGIAAEDQPRIFYPFLQVDGSYNRRQEGTGLGLSLTRELVELQGGRIWVESRKGQGSRFSFTIPLTRPGPSGRGRKAAPPAASAQPLDPAPPTVVTLDEVSPASSQPPQEHQLPHGGR